MTIEKERDIAVRALGLIAEFPKTREAESSAVAQRAFARTTLTEIAAIAAQASPVAQDADAAFEIHRIEQTKILGMPGLAARPCFTAGFQAGRASAAVPSEDAAKNNAIRQAQQHAMESETQRSTVISILRYFGLPENDWEALRLIKEKLEAAPAITIEPTVVCYTRLSTAPNGQPVRVYTDTPCFPDSEALGRIVPAAQPVGEAVAIRRWDLLHGQMMELSEGDFVLYSDAIAVAAPPVAQDQDGARYRWLRAKRDIPHGARNIPWTVALDPAEKIHTMVSRTGIELDFAIDAAMLAEVKS